MNTIYTFFRNLLWRWNGVYPEAKKRCMASSSFYGAHRMKIQKSHYLDIVYAIGLLNFALTHQEFVDPEYVLRDSVTLLQVTRDAAIFIEGKQGMPPAFSITTYSFATVGQIVVGEYIIVMPLSALLRLSEKLSDIGPDTVFLHNTARCGGTLVSNMLEHTGRVIAWNEPRVVDNVLRHANHTWNRKTSQSVLRATIKMLTKPYCGFEEAPSAYVIKLCAIYGSCWRLLRKAAPGATNLFLYRNLNAAALSTGRILPMVPICFPIYLASLSKNPHALAFVLYMLGCSGAGYADMPARYDYLLEWGYRTVLSNCKAFMDMRRNGLRIPALRYEDLISEPDTMVPALLKAVGIPESLTSRAMEALQLDSQTKAPFSQQAMADKKKRSVDFTELDSDFLEHMTQECEEAGVPGPYDWVEDFRLPGTIEPPSK